MKKTIAVVIAILWLSVPVLGRAVFYMTEDQMRKASDWIVMGKVSATRDLDESSTLNGHKCRGVETTFTISRVLKGDSTNPRTIVLHHYRLDQNIEYSYAPYLLNLNANRTDEYLLYLLKDGTGRFVPVSGRWIRLRTRSECGIRIFRIGSGSFCKSCFLTGETRRKRTLMPQASPAKRRC